MSTLKTVSGITVYPETIAENVQFDKMDIKTAITTLVGSPLVANKSSDMQDVSRVYVYTGSEDDYINGNWYYYEDHLWLSGGVYNSVAVETDKTLTLEDKPADSKTVGDLNTAYEDIFKKISNVIRVKYTCIDNGYENISNEKSKGFYSRVTDYIPCCEGQKFKYRGFGDSLAYSALFFDNNKKVLNYRIIKSRTEYTEVEIPSNCYFVKFQSFSYNSKEENNSFDVQYFEPSNYFLDLLNINQIQKIPSIENELKNIGEPTLFEFVNISSLLSLPYYISKKTGTVVDSTNNDAISTDFIECKLNDVFRISCYSQFQTCGVSFYDINKKFIKSDLYVSDENSNGVTFTNNIITIDEERIRFVRFCSYQPKYHQYKLEKYQPQKIYDVLKQNYNHADNILYGKKWTACGDSFTEGDFTGYADDNGLSGKNSPVIYDNERNMYKTYPWWIAERNNMILINEAKCGSKLTNVNNDESGNIFSLRYKNVPLDSDYITLMFGLNETGLTDEQIGSKNDSNTTTLWGVYNIIFEYFLTNAPYAKIGVIIPDAWMNVKYSNSTKEICEYWGIPYLDLKFDKNITMLIGGRNNVSTVASRLRDKSFKVSDSNSHPNLEAHKYRSTIIENWLRGL